MTHKWESFADSLVASFCASGNPFTHMPHGISTPSASSRMWGILTTDSGGLLSCMNGSEWDSQWRYAANSNTIHQLPKESATSSTISQRTKFSLSLLHWHWQCKGKFQTYFKSFGACWGRRGLLILQVGNSLLQCTQMPLPSLLIELPHALLITEKRGRMPPCTFTGLYIYRNGSK